MPVVGFEGRSPRVHPDAFIAPGAWVVGDVEIGPGSSVWFNAVVRGDSSSVRVGRGTNIQDGATLHTDSGVPCLVGDDCTVGHQAIVHASTVGDRCLIGMAAVVLSGAEVGSGSLVAAGSLVTGGMEIAPRSLVMGSPARRIRSLADDEVEALILRGARDYVRTASAYRRALQEGSGGG